MPENHAPSGNASTPSGVNPNAASGDERPLDILDRRSGLDRREIEALQAAIGDLPPDADPDAPLAPEPVTGLERRRGPGRRRSDFLRSAEEGQLNREQFLFLMAIEEFKRANARIFPAWTDVLEVLRLLGYRKTMPSELKLSAAEDWKEAPTTPSNVRPARWSERFRKPGAAEAA